MNTAIVYYSRHHGNTKKLLDAIAAKYPVTLIDAVETPDTDLSAYDCVGFASGIYYSKFHKSVTELAQKKLLSRKKVFFLYTCGTMKKGYTAGLAKIAGSKGCDILGAYGSLGYDTFGPFKLIGGIAKGHPTQSELEGAVQFYEGLSK